MNIGIYLLRNEIDGKIYVGQSSNIEISKNLKLIQVPLIDILKLLIPR